MFSLAKIYSTCMTLRQPNQPIAVDWQRGAKWIEDIRAKCGSIYAFHFEGQQIEGDILLTATDYKALRGS
jgi:hypothetical protein